MAAEHAITGTEIEVPVEGMTCAGCAARLERVLKATPGIREAAVNFATARARVSLAPDGEAAAAAEAVRAAGYVPREETVILSVEGMHCASCVGRVEKALEAVPGVLSARVNLAAGNATVRVLGEGRAFALRLAAAASAAGYAARAEETADETDERAARERRALSRDVALAAAATVPVVVLEMGAHLVPAFGMAVHDAIGAQTARLIAFALTAFVLFVPGRRFFGAGARALARGAPDMNSLVMLGTGAAFAYSTVATFAPGVMPAGTAHVYFEAAAVIVTLILAGRLLEARARGRTGEAIRRLLVLQPPTARIVRDGVETTVDVAAVAPGDVIAVRPGERVPVDGTVLEGATRVDEAMVTGEPGGVAKGPGNAVIGGTVNGTGAFRFRAEKVGAETLLARIVETVRQAQAAKLPVQRLVDRVTLVFVPAVMAAAALTFLVWLAFGPEPALPLALVNAVAVLVIACPCAMGLATPTSIMVGTGRAAELGVLFRRGEALEALKRADVVAFDKTGTLTEGRPALVRLAPAPGADGDEVLALAAAVEARSEHPVGSAVVEAAAARGFAVAEAEGFSAEAGRGVRGTVRGRAVLVGTARLMAAEGVDLAPLVAAAAAFEAEGTSPVYVAVDGRAAGVFAVADPVKETTADALAALRAMGLRIVMVTGDGKATADAVARRLGIDETIAEVLPTDKAAVVARLSADGARVAFVGDGINDAPALAEADVGIAVGTGTDIAIESADVVLMSGDLSGVATAFRLSRATMRNIAQNLAWAFGYNVALIPVAAGLLWPAFGILLSPVFAGLAMAASSVSVLLNALRLGRVGAARTGAPPPSAPRRPGPAPRPAVAGG